MTTPSTDSKPLRERLLPQTSIRTVMLLIMVAAVIMVIFREAIVGDAAFAKIAALLVQTIAASFIAYAVLFVIANFFALTTDPLVELRESTLQKNEEQQAIEREQ